MMVKANLRQVGLILLRVVWVSSVVAVGIYLAVIIQFPDSTRLDFVSMYTGAKVITSGKGSSLYTFETQRNIQSTVTGVKNNILPYRNPPYVALFYTPFTLLNYQTAYMVFVGVNIGLVFICGFLLAKLLNLERDLVFFITWMFLPTTYAILQGQPTLFLFLVWILVLMFLKRGNVKGAGILAGLFSVKPQFLLLVPVIFLMTKDKRQFLKSFGFSAAFVFLVSFIIAGKSLIAGYLPFLLQTEIPKYGSDWGSQVGIASFLYINLRGLGLPFIVYSVLDLVLICIFYTVVFFVSRTKVNRIIFLAFSAVIVLMLTPHIWDHDLVLISLPILILLANYKAYLSMLFFFILLLSPFLRFVTLPSTIIAVDGLLVLYIIAVNKKYFAKLRL